MPVAPAFRGYNRDLMLPVRGYSREMEVIPAKSRL